MNNTQTLQVGTILHSENFQYRIDKVLGQGSFGITYRATPILTGVLGKLSAQHKVAIKEFFMRDYNVRDGSTVIGGNSNNNSLYSYYKQKFVSEAHALSKLDHRNIVKVLELFETNETAYYVMEYCEGGSLDKLIEKNKGLKTDIAIKLFFQVADAIAYMHSNRMLHLDLKPANIVLRNSGEAVVIDFGLVKQFDSKGNPETSTTIGGGTPGYAPIEQVRHNDKDFPVTMDVYALGATLFKILTGVRPPESSDILNNGFPVYLFQEKGVDIKIVQCIMTAMALHRNDRYRSIESFSHALRSVYNNRLHDTTDPATDELQEVARNLYDTGVELYENGKSQEALELFLKAAKLEYVPAYSFIGYCYSHGTGINTNYAKAIEWYQKAADEGDNVALFNLGYIYHRRRGVRGDYDKAIYYYEQAAKQGNINALVNLGNCYMYGPTNISDENRALKYYRQAAQQGSADAQYNLGICYDKGYGVEPDKDEAIKWYSLAAQQGHDEAMNDLDTIISNDTIV